MSFQAHFAKLTDQNGGVQFYQGRNVLLIQPTMAGTTELTLLRLADGVSVKVKEKAADVAREFNKRARSFEGRFVELQDVNNGPLWLQGAAIAQLAPAGEAPKGGDKIMLVRLNELALKVKTPIETIAKLFTEISV